MKPHRGFKEQSILSTSTPMNGRPGQCQVENQCHCLTRIQSAVVKVKYSQSLTLKVTTVQARSLTGTKAKRPSFTDSRRGAAILWTHVVNSRRGECRLDRNTLGPCIAGRASVRFCNSVHQHRQTQSFLLAVLWPKTTVTKDSNQSGAEVECLLVRNWS